MSKKNNTVEGKGTFATHQRQKSQVADYKIFIANHFQHNYKRSFPKNQCKILIFLGDTQEYPNLGKIGQNGCKAAFLMMLAYIICIRTVVVLL